MLLQFVYNTNGKSTAIYEKKTGDGLQPAWNDLFDEGYLLL